VPKIIKKNEKMEYGIDFQRGDTDNKKPLYIAKNVL